MKRYVTCLLIAFALVTMSAVFPAQDNYILSDDYTVTIHGTSNLHEWDETVRKVTGSGAVSWNSDGSFDLDAISIKMEVFSIKSEHAVMDKKTFEALKAEDYPEIIFTLTAPVKSIDASSGKNIFSAKGNLKIAGVTKSVNLNVNVLMPEKGKLLFEGSQKINMKDYGVEPPTALFGMLKTGENITLNFKTNFINTINQKANYNIQ